MCTRIVRWDPDDEWPVRLLSIRDEDRQRPWSGLGAWWPAQPTVVGCRDDMLGGTWLAVDADSTRPRVAVVMNRVTGSAPPVRTSSPTTRRDVPSRGQLPLDAMTAAGPRLDAPYDPFELLVADADSAIEVRGGTGERGARTALDIGTTVGSSLGAASERVVAWRDAFAAAELGDPGVATSDVSTVWGGWTELLERPEAAVPGSGLLVAAHDPSARFGTVCTMLVALAADGRVRIDWNPSPDLAQSAWRAAEVQACSKRVP